MTLSIKQRLQKAAQEKYGKKPAPDKLENPEEIAATADSFLEQKDYAQAEIYYKKAIEFGNRKAFCNLATIYFIKKDFAGAKQRWEQACSLPGGEALASYNLGLMHHLGIGGTPVDVLLAKKYYLEALQAPDFYPIQVYENLVRICAYQILTTKDLTKKKELFKEQLGYYRLYSGDLEYQPDFDVEALEEDLSPLLTEEKESGLEQKICTIAKTYPSEQRKIIEIVKLLNANPQVICGYAFYELGLAIEKAYKRVDGFLDFRVPAILELFKNACINPASLSSRDVLFILKGVSHFHFVVDKKGVDDLYGEVLKRFKNKIHADVWVELIAAGTRLDMINTPALKELIRLAVQHISACSANRLFNLAHSLMLLHSNGMEDLPDLTPVCNLLKAKLSHQKNESGFRVLDYFKVPHDIPWVKKQNIAEKNPSLNWKLEKM